MASPIIASFAAGEWSPQLRGRVDLQKYFSACELLENMICQPHGPAFQRPGLRFVSESLGRNEIKNGNFEDDSEWVQGDPGWTISNGKLVGTAGPAAGWVSQVILVMEKGKQYEIRTTVEDYGGSGTFRYVLGTVYGPHRTANGVYVDRVTNTGNFNVSMVLEKSADFSGKIDTVHVREVAPPTRLISFNFSIVQSYILAFTPYNIRIFKDGGLVVDEYNDPVEIATPYCRVHLLDLNYTQSADTFYIAHSSHKPCKLERWSHTDWKLSEITFECWPGHRIKGVNRTAKEGDPFWVRPVIQVPDHGFIAGDDIFIWGVASPLEVNGTHNIYDVKDSTFKLSNIDADDWWLYETQYGGQVVRIAKINGATQANPVVITANNHRFAHGDQIFIDEIVGMTELNGHHYEIANTTADTYELLGIDGSAYSAYVSGGRCDLSGEDFSSEDHYPSCVEFFEERLFWAGSLKKPQTIWGSASGDYQNNRQGAAEDDAIEYPLAAKGVNPILWIVPHTSLIVGTAGAEWEISASNREEPISAVNVKVRRHSTWGNSKVGALLVNDVILFLQRGGKKLREFAYSFEKDSYVAPDLTILAEHIAGRQGFIEMAHQQEPAGILWCVRSDGDLAGLTYERMQEVVGWFRIKTNGKFKSVEVIPGLQATEDRVWVAVKRTIDGTERVYIEYFAEWVWGRKIVSGLDPERAFYVDSGLSYDGGLKKAVEFIEQTNPVIVHATAHNFIEGEKVKIEDIGGMDEVNGNTYLVKDRNDDTFYLYNLNDTALDGTGFSPCTSGGTAKRVVSSCSNLDHLKNTECVIVADGCVVEPQTVSDSGIIQIGSYANQIHVGLPYTAKLKPMDLEAGQSEGTSKGKIKRIHSITMSFIDTMACKVGSGEDDLEEILFRSDADPADKCIQPFAGEKELKGFPGGYLSGGHIMIQNDTPLPLTVVALMPKLRTYEG
jgi:hypothetical protein